MLDDTLYWDGRALAASLRYRNISAMIEALLAREMKRPSLKPVNRGAGA